MKTINNLSSSDSLSLGDLLAFWSSNNGDTRKVSMNTLVEFIQAQGGDADISTTSTITGLKDIDPNTNTSNYIVLGGTILGDGLGGIYHYDGTSTLTDDGFLVVASDVVGVDGRWLRMDMDDILVVDTVTDMNNLNVDALGITKTVFVKEDGFIYTYNGLSWVSNINNDIANINNDIANINTRLKLDTLTDLRELIIPYDTVWVSGYHTEKDGAFGSNIFEWDENSIEPDNGFDVIKLNTFQAGRYKLKISGLPTPQMAGAFGNDINIDTAALKIIQSKYSTIDLNELELRVTSSYIDAVNGIRLTSDFINGILIVDGKERVFDKNKSFSLSANNKIPSINTKNQVGINKLSDDKYLVYQPLGDYHWQQNELSRTASTVPFNLKETIIKQVFGYTLSEDKNDILYSGAWATIDAQSGLSSASTTSYVGGRARQSVTIGDSVDIDWTGEGDLYIMYIGRPSASHVSVSIDNGGDNYSTLPLNGSGQYYFDSYTSSDLQYKQLVRIASNLPRGTYKITLTVLTDKNPASTGNRFLFNALLDTQSNPWDVRSDALKWEAGEAILKNEVRKNGINYYYAVEDGTTGATPPTHTSGSVSDGGVTWTYRAESGFETVTTKIQASGSQLEYAYQIKPSGATSLEDVGGELHGNEEQLSFVIYAGHQPTELNIGQWASGDTVSIKELIKVTHSEISAGSTEIVSTSLSRRFNAQEIYISHQHKLNFDSEFGFFYPHMLPLVHWDADGNYKYVFNEIYTPSDGTRKMEDYYGISNPIIGNTKDLIMIAYGDVYAENGAAGVPTSVEAPLSIQRSLEIDPKSVKQYNDASVVFAGKAMNLTGGDFSSGGYSSGIAKMYFERYQGGREDSGTIITCSASYKTRLIPKR